MSGAPAHSTGDHRQSNLMREFRGNLSLEEEFDHGEPACAAPHTLGFLLRVPCALRDG
eukprot:SAG22_NODE_417_length_10770_cov_21.649049_10_plen_58_part_00